MNISLQNIDKVSALLIVNIEKADYEQKVEKTLKEYRKRANIPGFRPGMVPMGMIKKQYGKAVLVDEVDKLMQEEVNKYIHDNKVNMLGAPLPNEEKQAVIDFDTQENFEFVFDLALAPEFKATLTANDKLVYYNIGVADEMVENRATEFATRQAKHDETVQEYQERDMLKGLMCQLDESGDTKDGGIQAENAVMMPVFMKNDEQKALFDNAKVGDVIVFEPWVAFGESDVEMISLLSIKKEDLENAKTKYSYQIQSITRAIPAEYTPELFDTVFPKGAIKTKEEFLSAIKDMISKDFEQGCDLVFRKELRKYMMNKIGKVEYADTLMKRIMKSNNPDKDASYVDDNYDKSIEELTWHLIKNQLMSQFDIVLDDNDILNEAKAATKAQFAQYGMMNVPDDLLTTYATEMLKKAETVDSLAENVMEKKLATAVKDFVKLDKKEISVDEFNKLEY